MDWKKIEIRSKNTTKNNINYKKKPQKIKTKSANTDIKN